MALRGFWTYNYKYWIKNTLVSLAGIISSPRLWCAILGQSQQLEKKVRLGSSASKSCHAVTIDMLTITTSWLKNVLMEEIPAAVSSLPAYRNAKRRVRIFKAKHASVANVISMHLNLCSSGANSHEEAFFTSNNYDQSDVYSFQTIGPLHGIKRSRIVVW